MPENIAITPPTQPALPGVDEPRAGLIPLSTLQALYRNPHTGEILSERTIQLWAERGWFPKGDYRGLYPLRAVIGGVYWAQLDIINRKKGPASDEIISIELETEKERLRKLILENDQTEGLLIPIDKVRRSAFEKFRTVRDALEAIPSRLAPLLAAEKEEFNVRELLRKEINHVLSGLAKKNTEGAEHI